MDGVTTVNDAFALVSGRGGKVAWQWLDGDAGWKPISSAEVYGRVRALAGALAELGVDRGDRVVLLCENRWEWPVTDFAVLALGAVDVPLYPTLTAEQVGYMLRDSGAKVAVVSSREQWEKVKAAGDLPELKCVVVADELVGIDKGASPGQTIKPSDLGHPEFRTVQFSSLMAKAGEMQGRDAEFDASLKSVKPEDLATIIYTSGTTGEPKGVMLTHGNLASNFSITTEDFGFGEKDRCISFLPLSHVTARHLDYALMCDGATIAYCPKFDLLAAAMKAVRPTIFVAVPRVYEKIRQGVEGKSVGLKKKILGWALGVGAKYRVATLGGLTPREKLWFLPALIGGTILLVLNALIVSREIRGGLYLFLIFYFVCLLFIGQPLSWKIADKLVFGKIREAFGGEVGIFVSGGAPLGMDTAGWFADVGIQILEGYGLTETSPVIGLNTSKRSRIGTVGPVLKNLEVRFAGDGELEVKGPSVFAGYWKKDEETRKAFTADGWFCTGDIGKLEDGFLSITDRKKELLKTSGGKLIAPQPIENKLKANSLVSNAALVGDKHKFACVLLSPNFAALEGWAKGQGISAGDRGALVKDAKVVAEYQAIVDKVNGTLAHFEGMKRMSVVAEEWSVEGGELTPSMKIKRRVIEKKYEGEIGEFYKDEATAAVGKS